MQFQKEIMNHSCVAFRWDSNPHFTSHVYFIQNGMLRKRKVLLLIIMIFTLCMIILSFTFILFNSEELFITFPYFDEISNLVFELSREPDQLSFFIKGQGMSSLIKLNTYCQERSCSIPLVIGGTVTFDILRNTKLLYSDTFNLPALMINCTNEPWTNRVCTFRNICYSQNLFSIESPYPINFDQNFLCLGSKTPPIDLELNRVNGCLFTTAQVLNSWRIPQIKQHSYLVSIYYNMRMLWHTNFDYLLPLFLTLESYSADDDILNSRIFLPHFVPTIPPITQALSRFPVEKLNKSLCFREMTMGMIKITNLSLDKNDPPYSFCTNCSTRLRSTVLSYFNISTKSTNIIKIIFLGRRTLNRVILNENELFKSLQSYFTRLNNNSHKFQVELRHFEHIPLKKQIEIMSECNILISIHGSGLANLIWMKHGSVVVEILPQSYSLDWYQRASTATGIIYHSYHANEIETIGGNPTYVKDCLKQIRKVKTVKCNDVLRDRNITLNVHAFLSDLSGFLKSEKIL